MLSDYELFKHSVSEGFSIKVIERILKIDMPDLTKNGLIKSWLNDEISLATIKYFESL